MFQELLFGIQKLMDQFCDLAVKVTVSNNMEFMRAESGTLQYRDRISILIEAPFGVNVDQLVQEIQHLIDEHQVHLKEQFGDEILDEGEEEAVGNRYVEVHVSQKLHVLL